MRPLSLVTAVLLAACGGGSDGPRDASNGHACRNTLDCEGHDVGYFCNAAGECEFFCKDVPGGHVCNYGFASDWPPTCCTADQSCCEVGFEHEECLAAGQGCPIFCYSDPSAGDWYFTCAAGSWCVVDAPAPPPDAGVADAGGADAGLRDAGTDTPDAGPGACLFAVNCTSTCPSSQQCGQNCCPLGTTCRNFCCVQ